MQTACSIKLVELRYLPFFIELLLHDEAGGRWAGASFRIGLLSAQAPETLPAGVSNSSPLDETQLTPVLALLFLKLDLSSTWSRLFSHNSPLLVVLPSSKASPPIPKLPPTCQRSCRLPCCRARCLSSSSSSHVSSLHSSSGHCHLNVAPCGYFSWILKEEKEDCEWD